MKAPNGKHIAEEKLAEIRSAYSRAKGDDRKYLEDLGKLFATAVKITNLKHK